MSNSKIPGRIVIFMLFVFLLPIWMASIRDFACHFPPLRSCFGNGRADSDGNELKSAQLSPRNSFYDSSRSYAVSLSPFPSPNMSGSSTPNLSRSSSPNLNRSSSPNLNRSSSANLNRNPSGNLNRISSGNSDKRSIISNSGTNSPTIPNISRSTTPNLSGRTTPNLSRSPSANLSRSSSANSMGSPRADLSRSSTPNSSRSSSANLNRSGSDLSRRSGSDLSRRSGSDLSRSSSYNMSGTNLSGASSANFSDRRSINSAGDPSITESEGKNSFDSARSASLNGEEELPRGPHKKIRNPIVLDLTKFSERDRKFLVTTTHHLPPESLRELDHPDHEQAEDLLSVKIFELMKIFSKLRPEYWDGARRLPQKIVMKMSRETIVEESELKIKYFLQKEQGQDSALRKLLDIQFKGEKVNDSGGVTKEWFELITKQIFDPEKNKQFRYSPSGSDEIDFNPYFRDTQESLRKMKFYGRVVGMALFNNRFIYFPFEMPFFYILLGQAVTLDIVAVADPLFHESLARMLEGPIPPGAYIANFQVEDETNEEGSKRSFDLGPNASKVSITEENKMNYIKRRVAFRYYDRSTRKIEAFRTGFYEVIPKSVLKDSGIAGFELEALLNGIPVLDIQDLKRATVFPQNNIVTPYRANDLTIIHLWQVLKEFDAPLRSKFLQFVTGSSRVPVGPLRNGTMAINKAKNTAYYPQAHTCSNTLDLPDYRNKDILRERLLISLDHQGYVEDNKLGGKKFWKAKLTPREEEQEARRKDKEKETFEKMKGVLLDDDIDEEEASRIAGASTSSNNNYAAKNRK